MNKSNKVRAYVQSAGHVLYLELKPVVNDLLIQPAKEQTGAPFIITLDLFKKESSQDYRPLIRDLVRRGAHKYQFTSTSADSSMRTIG